jgi:hypothetical protein
MRTVIRRVGGGVLAYLATYALIALLTAPRMTEYLRLDEREALAALEIYRGAGEPMWQAVGWLTVNAHNVPVTIRTDEGTVATITNFVLDGGGWLGVLPGWLGLVPVVACLLVGLAIAVTSPRSVPVTWSIGAYMTVGYVPALLASTVLFSGTVGPVDAKFVLIQGYPADRWLLPTIVAPLIFGSIGAFVGRSPVLDSALDRIASTT